MEINPDGSDADIEDRRDESGGGGMDLGGGGGGGFGGIHLGIGGVIIVGILSLVFRHNFFALFSGSAGSPVGDSAPSAAPYRAPSSGTEGRTQTARTPQDALEQPEYQFVRAVLNDVQESWDRNLPAMAGVPYRHAKLVLYRDSWPSACGQASMAVGPFYCPADQKVYLDLGFFDELAQRFGAPGKFAQAYVIAHELGHHVQKLLGIEGKVRQLQESRPSQQNPLSVRVELQADCFAGVWGSTAEGRLKITPGDIAQGLNAAAAVGDDRLQRAARGTVSPETFTHGSSAQRTAWFKRGLEGGQISGCNTFAGM